MKHKHVRHAPQGKYNISGMLHIYYLPIAGNNKCET